jgi:hypothetical protein
VTYAYQLQDLLTLLNTKAPIWANLPTSTIRSVEFGLLSVGLKIHCLEKGDKFDGLIEGLGGPARVVEVNHYKDERPSFCLVLPPV